MDILNHNCVFLFLSDEKFPYEYVKYMNEYVNSQNRHCSISCSIRSEDSGFVMHPMTPVLS
jgi:hypothetical protein